MADMRSIAAMEFPDHAQRVLVWRLCPEEADEETKARLGPQTLYCRFTAIPAASVINHPKV